MTSLTTDEYLSMDRSGDIVVLFNRKKCRSCKKMIEQSRYIEIPDGVNFYTVVPDYRIMKEHGLFIFPSISVFKNKVEYATHLGIFKNNDDIDKFNLQIWRIFDANPNG